MPSLGLSREDSRRDEPSSVVRVPAAASPPSAFREEVAVRMGVAGRGVAGEDHPGAAVVVAVAEHHQSTRNGTVPRSSRIGSRHPVAAMARRRSTTGTPLRPRHAILHKTGPAEGLATQYPLTTSSTIRTRGKRPGGGDARHPSVSASQLLGMLERGVEPPAFESSTIGRTSR